MISLKPKIAFMAIVFLSLPVAAEPLGIICEECRGPDYLYDYGNFAVNQIYGPDAWVPAELRGELNIYNLQGDAVYVDLDYVVDSNWLIDIIALPFEIVFSVFVQEIVDFGIPTDFQVDAFNSYGQRTVYRVPLAGLNSLGPLNVGSGSGPGGNTGGGSSGGSNVPGNGGGGWGSGEGPEPGDVWHTECSAGPVICFVDIP